LENLDDDDDDGGGGGGGGGGDDDDVDIIIAWETSRLNIKISAKENPGLTLFILVRHTS
jgi:hypothetical protein